MRKKVEVSELQGPLTELMAQLGGQNGRERFNEFNLWLKRVETTGDLAPRGEKTITLARQHNPDQFYRTRSGLYVWDGFRSKVVSKAKVSEAGTTHKVRFLDLVRSLTDAKIELALPTDHLFDESALCAIIEGLIAEQEHGEEGVLLNNGYANLFYTPSWVVRVHWSAGVRGWGVGAWGRGVREWYAGYRVFSPAT